MPDLLRETEGLLSSRLLICRALRRAREHIPLIPAQAGVYSQWFERIIDAIAAERQVKGWSRAKKEALMRGDFWSLRTLSSRKAQKSVN